jgi:hypothetical protein
MILYDFILFYFILFYFILFIALVIFKLRLKLSCLGDSSLAWQPHGQTMWHQLSSHGIEASFLN